MINKPRNVLPATLLITAMLCPIGANADVTVYDKDDKTVVIGGRIQVQYSRTDPDAGSTTDDIQFRRLRPFIEATVTPDWIGKIEIDFGKAVEGDEVAVKDAYMRYTGWDNMTLTIGNAKPPFSREFLTSSKRQHTVERSFVGNHNFGAPDRQIGALLSGKSADKRIGFAASVGFEQFDPDAKKMDFDSPANDQGDWNQGTLVVGRLDFFPQGSMKFEQGDFDRGPVKTNFSVAAFSWSNDGDNNTYTAGGISTSSSKADLDKSNGLELSAGLRGRGVSVDAEFQRIGGETIDPGFTGGMYRNGETDLEKFHVEGGYMLAGNKVEVVAKYESMDADNFATSWDAVEVGANYFWNKHKTKAQVTYRSAQNVNGVNGADEDVLYMQWQFVF